MVPPPLLRTVTWPVNRKGRLEIKVLAFTASLRQTGKTGPGNKAEPARHGYSNGYKLSSHLFLSLVARDAWFCSLCFTIISRSTREKEVPLVLQQV